MYENPEILTTTEARQATSNKLNLRVLIMSMILAVVVGGLVYAVFYNRTGQSTAQAPAVAEDRR